MSDAWDGRPQNPERDGWHWLRRADGFTAPYCWRAVPRVWLYPPDWELMPEDKEIYRQSYIGPCLLPSEIAAREAAAAAAMREAAAMKALATRAPQKQPYSSDWETAANLTTNLGAESIAACKARAEVYRQMERWFGRLTTTQCPATWEERMRKLAEDWEAATR